MKTKRLLSFLAVLMSMSAFTATAHDVGDLAYVLYTPSGSSTPMVKCTGLSVEGNTKNTNGTIGDIYIPSGITYSDGNNYRVYAIEKSAFADKKITGLTINWGVREIGDFAFQGCTKMTKVHLASSVQVLGANAFWSCSALKQVYWNGFNLPSGIYSTSFPGNSGMTLYVGNEMTASDTEIKSSILGSNFATITRNNRDCSDIDFGDYALTIGTSDNQGYGASRDATVVFLRANASITGRPTSYASGNYKGVTYKWTKIGTYALPANSTTTTIDLTAATNLTYIGNLAFEKSTALTKLTLPKSLNSVNLSFVDGCTALTEFAVASESTSYSTYSGALYNKAQTTLWRVPEGKTGYLYFPSTLKTVSSWALDQCKKVTSAYLPYGVTSIGQSAFRGASELKYVKIPSSVTSLNASGVFNGVNSTCRIICNMQNPPTVTASSYFGTNSGMTLLVPYGKESAYSSAGWTGFKYVNPSGDQAYDIEGDDFHFTVTSTASTTVNGTSYGGRVKLVCGYHSNMNSQTSYTVPGSISFNVNGSSKTFAVTMIGEKAFQNHTSNFTVAGCANVDTVGNAAFQNQPITSYAFTHNLKVILNYAFSGAGLTGTVALPYGIKKLGLYAFAHGKYTRIIVPSSLTNHFGDFCAYTTTLKELIWNKAFSYDYTGWDLSDVPTTCYIRVPMGYVNHFKQGTLKARAAYITGGAYDFAYDNDFTGRYYLTITSNSSTTFDGTTYAGKAKYVYHPNIKESTLSSNYGWAISEEDRTVSNDIRKYLITELGDSLLAGVTNFGIDNNIPTSVTRISHDAFYNASKVSVANLTLPDGLTYIGDYAFSYTQLSGEIKIPSSVTYIGKYVFNNSKLNALYFPGAKPSTLDKYAWGTSNASNFTVWVPNEYANSYLTTANGWGTDYAKKLAVWIKPYATTQMFSSVVPTDLQGSNITAYYASAYDKNNSTAQVTLSKANMAPENTGLLLVDMETSKEYRIKRPTTSVSAPMTNYLVATATGSVNVYSQTVGYYWEYRTPSNLRFVRPTTGYTTAAGGAYLKLSSAEAGNLTEVFTNLWPKQAGGKLGDVDGNNMVDVDDVNAAINLILNYNAYKNQYKYPQNADMDGNNMVDVDDVNLIINIILEQ